MRRTPTLARHILGTNEVYLSDVVVPRENLVGPQDKGWSVMLSTIELEKVIITGGYLGAAQATLDEMLAFAKTRHAFGRPVGTFQALAHAMADLQVEIDSARLLAYRAAWLLAQGQPCGREGSMAKLKGSETYVAAARLGMQVCAGHGFSTESVMSFRYRESIVATISGGTSQIQRNGIARSMGLRTLLAPDAKTLPARARDHKAAGTAAAPNCSRSGPRRILPTGVRSSSAVNSNDRGHLKPARCSRQ